MSIEISSDQKLAIEQSRVPCIHVRDSATNKVYLLIEEGTLPELEEEHLDYMRRGVAAALEQSGQGKESPWDIAHAIELGRRHAALRPGGEP